MIDWLVDIYQTRIIFFEVECFDLCLLFCAGSFYVQLTQDLTTLQRLFRLLNDFQNGFFRFYLIKEISFQIIQLWNLMIHFKSSMAYLYETSLSCTSWSPFCLLPYSNNIQLIHLMDLVMP